MADHNNDLWGLGGFAGWTSDGIDRFALGSGGLVLGGARSKWQRVPTLHEHVVEDEKAGERESRVRDTEAKRAWNGGFGWDQSGSSASMSEWAASQVSAN